MTDKEKWQTALTALLVSLSIVDERIERALAFGVEPYGEKEREELKETIDWARQNIEKEEV